MSGWKVTWTKSAHDYYQKMTRGYQQRVKRAVIELEKDPFASKHVQRLHGELEGLCRYRIGEFRMIFRVIEQETEVRILAIAARGDVYK